MPPSRRHISAAGRRVSPARRRALRLGAVGLAGALAGCTSGMLNDEGDDPASGTTAPDSATTRESGIDSTTTGDGEPASGSTTTGDSDADPTTHPAGVDTSLPDGSVEFPDGPKSPPERPADLTADAVREYVLTYERRYVYNSLHYDETSEVHRECGVDSVVAYGDGFRVVAWCSAYSNTGGENATTMHADWFTQYATYFVGPDATVRREGKSETRE